MRLNFQNPILHQACQNSRLARRGQGILERTSTSTLRAFYDAGVLECRGWDEVNAWFRLAVVMPQNHDFTNTIYEMCLAQSAAITAMGNEPDSFFSRPIVNVCDLKRSWHGYESDSLLDSKIRLWLQQIDSIHGYCFDDILVYKRDENDDSVRHQLRTNNHWMSLVLSDTDRWFYLVWDMFAIKVNFKNVKTATNVIDSNPMTNM